MLKHRVIALLLIREGLCVQSLGFCRYRPLGRPEIAIEHLNAWGADEILCLRIDQAGGRADSLDQIAGYASRCQAPLAVGGGIGDMERVARAISTGADKVVINTALVTAPHVVEEAARRYGSQSVVASIDCRLEGGVHRAWIRGGREPAGLTARELARRAEDLGAGELILTSIERDGSGTGYDLDLLSEVAAVSRLPIIAAGGAGRPDHLEAALAAGAQAVAVGNMLHFTEHALTLAKRHLADRGIPVRLDSPFRYDGARLDPRGRLLRRDEQELSRLRFVKIEPVVV